MKYNEFIWNVHQYLRAGVGKVADRELPEVAHNVYKTLDIISIVRSACCAGLGIQLSWWKQKRMQEFYYSNFY
jgi:hypothetical protein